MTESLKQLRQDMMMVNDDNVKKNAVQNRKKKLRKHLKKQRQMKRMKHRS